MSVSEKDREAAIGALSSLKFDQCEHTRAVGVSGACNECFVDRLAALLASHAEEASKAAFGRGVRAAALAVAPAIKTACTNCAAGHDAGHIRLFVQAAEAAIRGIPEDRGGE